MFKPRVKVIDICKADYAVKVLRDSRHVACLMPCTLAVYETDNGGVSISKMNTGVMGKVFGGTISEIMGDKVTKDIDQILKPIIK